MLLTIQKESLVTRCTASPSPTQKCRGANLIKIHSSNSDTIKTKHSLAIGLREINSQDKEKYLT